MLTQHLRAGDPPVHSTWRWVQTPPGGGSTLHLHLDPHTYLGHVGILIIGHFSMFGREQIANQVKRPCSLFSGETWFYLLSSPPGESSPKTNQTLKKTLKNKSERFRFKRVGWKTEKRNFIPCSDGPPRGFGKIFLFLCSFSVCSIQILPDKCFP